MTEKVIIMGSGPAGLSAAIYTAREGFEPLVISGYNGGGQLILTTLVENIPGFPEGVMGPEYMQMLMKQAKKFGTRFVDKDVTAVDLKSRPIKVTVEEQVYETNTLIIATGANAKYLGLESEKKFMGRGVSSCATCLPPESLVIANPSVKPIKEVKVGDKVLTDKGTFERVREVMSRRFKGKLVGIKSRFFRDGITFMTPNHPVLIRKLQRGTGARYHEVKWSEPAWVPAKELAPGQMVMYPIPSAVKARKFIDIAEELSMKVDNRGRVYFVRESPTAHRIKSKVSINHELARLVGYYLAEGFAHKRGISFAFKNDEYEYIRDTKRLIEKLFGLEAHIRIEGSVARVTVYSLILSKLFEKLFGRYSSDKRLPMFFLYLPADLQEELIKGYWRGDGCSRKEDFVITTSSRVLLEQVKMVFLRLGILPTIEKRKQKTLRFSRIGERLVEFKENVYQIRVGGPWIQRMSKVLGEKHEKIRARKTGNYHGWLKDGYALLPIKRVLSRNFNGLVYNLAVDKENTYVTPNSTLHNCDAAFFKNKNVIVVGGGDTAMEDSLFLTRFASTVTIVHRRDAFRASKIMQERVMSNPKIKVLWNTTVEEIKGDKVVKSVVLKDVATGQKRETPIDGVFLAIGYEPNTKLFEGQLRTDEQGYLVTKEEIKTDLEGVYVAGDVADKVYRQAGTAAGSGIKAALAVRAFMQEVEAKKQP